MDIPNFQLRLLGPFILSKTLPTAKVRDRHVAEGYLAWRSDRCSILLPGLASKFITWNLATTFVTLLTEAIFKKY